LQELEIGVVNFKARVTDEERTSARNEIEERDTQINRLKKKVSNYLKPNQN
jgi:hypothetical protein